MDKTLALRKPPKLLIGFSHSFSSSPILFPLRLPSFVCLSFFCHQPILPVFFPSP